MGGDQASSRLTGLTAGQGHRRTAGASGRASRPRLAKALPASPGETRPARRHRAGHRARTGRAGPRASCPGSAAPALPNLVTGNPSPDTASPSPDTGRAGAYPGDFPSAGEITGSFNISELVEAEYARTGYGAPPRGRPPGQPGTAADGAPGEGLVKSSAVMAIGTLASRVTGLIRSLVLVFALGLGALGNVYQYANTLPNAVYNLAIGGILTSVIVPLLVSAAKRHRDGGEQYDQRMFTLVTITLGVVTIAATIAAGPIAGLYDPKATGTQYHLLVMFAYFFIPQIFFYGVSSLAGAILNARGHFAAPMWTPVVNNIVVILISVAFMVVASGQNVNKVGTVTNGEVLLLGAGTTLGIIAQTVALIPALRRVGFRWHPRFDFRKAEIREIGRMSGWMFGYVLTTQVAFLVTSMVASTAKTSHSFAAYSSAWLLFQLPYAIVAISVITALLPRMSAHASDGEFDLVRNDFSTGVRLGSVVVAPAGLVLAVLGPSLGVVLFGWGATSDASARYLGLVFSIFSLGLVPYMLFQLLLRVFYSLHDSKTPALIGVVTMITNVIANLLALAIFPKSEVVAALGAGFGLSNLAGSIVAWRIMSRRLGGLAWQEIKSSLLRMHAAAIPAALFALIVAIVVGGALAAGKLSSALVVIVGGGGALLIYVLFSRILKVAEVTDLTAMVRSRLRR